MSAKFKYIEAEKIILGKNIRSTADSELGGLIASIEKHDVLQPILVIPKGEKYELVAGSRRFRALNANGEPMIPCLVRNDITEKEIPYIKLTENIQRKQMSASELVLIFDEMLANTPRLTIGGLAQMIGKSPEWIYIKYKVDKILTELIEQGLPEDAINDLSETDLLKLSRRVKNPSVKQQKQKVCTNSDLRKIGFKIVLSGKYNVLVVCKDEIVRNQIMDVLRECGQRNTDDLEEAKSGAAD